MLEQLGDSIVPVTAICGTFIFLTSWVIAATIDSCYKTFSNTKLKSRLVERGFSAQEIDTIIKAGTSEYEIAPQPPVKV